MNTQLTVLIAAALAPLITAILTIPYLYSKTYIQTLITEPYNFTTQTLKTYIKNTTILYTPLTILWAIGLVTLTTTATQFQTHLLTKTLTIIITTSLAHFLITITQTNKLQSYLNPNTTFTLPQRKHTLIFATLTLIHLSILTSTFFTLISII